MMRAMVTRAGKLVVGEIPKPMPLPATVLIRVHGAAVNRADLLQKRGLYPPPPGASEILGLECSGTVEATFGNSSRFRVGDRVMALLRGGGYAEYALAEEGCVMPVPTTISLSEAAVIPEVWLTAYQLIVRVAKLQHGENIMIHAGASGVGLAASQIAKDLLGAHHIVTSCGSDSKCDASVRVGRASASVNYRSLKGSLSDAVIGAMKGERPNVLLDCIGGSVWVENLKMLDMDGRWILFGTMGGTKPPEGINLGHLLSKRVAVITSTLRNRSAEYQADLVRSFSNEVLPKLAAGKLHITIDSIYDLRDAEEAHRHVEQNENIGKVLLAGFESLEPNRQSDETLQRL
uniref:Enoyl reductase (ER) domain-containing protein n=1 Tax=Compsopogon caeruleus TaxID=31354 RepID=A0A7S1TFP6_9RHOD|mmetsp:Transcript_18411/g.38541  ORF Transcript_18411/g.38541 Transcript_18411/m.38541 type:complete len:347 (+) Transcript_18411:233-1273(+)